MRFIQTHATGSDLNKVFNHDEWADYCRFCKERRQKELEDLVIKLKEK